MFSGKTALGYGLWSDDVLRKCSRSKTEYGALVQDEALDREFSTRRRKWATGVDYLVKCTRGYAAKTVWRDICLPKVDYIPEMSILGCTKSTALEDA